MKMKVSGNALISDDGDNIEVDLKRHNFKHLPGFMFHSGAFIGFQSPPRKQMVHVKNVGQEKEEVFELQLPWLLYVVSLFKDSISNIYLFGSPDRIRSFDQRFYSMPLPNLYADGRFCLPGGNFEVEDDLEAIYAKVYDVVWGSWFNRDLFDRVHDQVDEYGFMEIPEELSTNPMLKSAWHSMLSPGEIFRQWEEKITIKTLDQLFNRNISVYSKEVRDQMPYYGAKTLIRSNGLHTLS